MRSLVLVTLSVVLAVPLLAVSSASAAERPLTGECFDVTIAQADDYSWPDVSAIPCNGPHAIEVVKASPLPADVDSVVFAKANCAYARVMKSIGVNVPVRAVVPNPIRLGMFPFIVSGDGAPASYVCAVGALRYNGAGEDTFEPMTSAVADLTVAQKRSLRFCMPGKDRDPGTKDVTVACAQSPRWQATAWVELDQIFATYPGAATVRARTKALCPAATAWTTPSVKAWDSGYMRAWCWKKYP